MTWSARHGHLALAPPYLGGGEIGGHLAFCYTAAGVYYAVTLHAWTSVFRFTVDGVPKAVTLHAKPSVPKVIATLRSIVSSAS